LATGATPGAALGFVASVGYGFDVDDRGDAGDFAAKKVHRRSDENALAGNFLLIPSGLKAWRGMFASCSSHKGLKTDTFYS
jgi:hypothetical protein